MRLTEKGRPRAPAWTVHLSYVRGVLFAVHCDRGMDTTVASGCSPFLRAAPFWWRPRARVATLRRLARACHRSVAACRAEQSAREGVLTGPERHRVQTLTHAVCRAGVDVARYVFRNLHRLGLDDLVRAQSALVVSAPFPARFSPDGMPGADICHDTLVAVAVGVGEFLARNTAFVVLVDRVEGSVERGAAALRHVVARDRIIAVGVQRLKGDTV